MPVGWLQKIKLWGPPFLWALCILLTSSIPGDDLPEQEIPNLDKVVHFGIYAVFGFLLSRGTASFRLALGLATLFALADELYQNLTPYRSPDPWDCVADVAGACAGILFYRWFFHYVNRRGISP
jgi:VanZ family protein